MNKTSALTLALLATVPVAALAADDGQQETRVAQYYSDSFESKPYYDTNNTFFQQAPLDVSGVADSQQDTTTVGGTNKWDVTLGAAALSLPEYVGAEENNFYVFPFVSATYHFDQRNKAFFSPQSGLGLKHVVDNKWTVGAKVDWRQDRDSSDDPSLSGLQDIDTAFEAGPFVQYRNNRFLLGASLLGDVSGTHDGFVLEASAKYRLPVANPQVVSHVGASTLYGSDEFMETYFTVSAADAIAGRPAFDADAGFATFDVHGDVMYLIDDNWFVRGDAIISNLIGDADDTAVTEESTTITGILSTGYRF